MLGTMNILARAITSLVILAASAPAQLGWFIHSSIGLHAQTPLLVVATAQGLQAVAGADGAVSPGPSMALTVYQQRPGYWLPVGSTGFPAGHVLSQIVHDLGRGVTIVRLRRADHVPSNLTYEWNGTAWSTVSTTLHGGVTPWIGTAPPSIWPIAYDEATQLVFLVTNTETYQLDASGWSRQQIAGIQPSVQMEHGTFAYNPLRSTMTLVAYNTMWDFDAVYYTWTWYGNAPIWPFDDSMVFDPTVNRLHTGSYEWDGTQWSTVIGGPSTVAFDAVSQQLVGYSGGSFFYATRTPAYSITPFGNGCPNALGMPQLVVPREAVLAGVGGSAVIELNNIPQVPLAVPYLAIGFSNTAWGGGPLPCNLAPFGYSGCYLNVSPDYFSLGIGGTYGNGRWLFSAPLYSPAYLGMHYYVQGMAVELFGGASCSQGMDCMIGVGS